MIGKGKGHHHRPPKYHPEPTPADPAELRLEYVTTSVGFDDLLDVTLGLNHPHFDSVVVVTSHNDKKTQAVAAKHGAICVQTDLFGKNGRQFNKGAAINDGFGRFQYRGWRVHMDSDIVVPDNFRRMLFNHTCLETYCIYGADRIDVIETRELRQALSRPQHAHSHFLTAEHNRKISSRYVDVLRGYVPIGYFQLWHASCQHEYPWSLGSAAHDDVLFAHQWPRQSRRLLPTVILWHLLPEPTRVGQNWEGRKSKRLQGQP